MPTITNEITESALIKRINRKLAPQRECIRKARGRYVNDLGDHYRLDVSTNGVIGQHVDLEDLARDPGRHRRSRDGGHVKLVIDDTGGSDAIIRRRLQSDRPLHLRLIEETHRMMQAGAVIEDIVWMLSEHGGTADRRQHWEANAPPGAAWLFRDLPARVPGKMFVVYIGGPEGNIIQQWDSILTAPPIGES